MTPAMTETIARMKASPDRTIYRLPGGMWTVKEYGSTEPIKNISRRPRGWWGAAWAVKWGTIRALENAGIIHPILGQEPIGLRPRKLRDKVK